MLALAKPIFIVKIGIPFCLSIFGEILISRHLNPPLLNKCNQQMFDKNVEYRYNVLNKRAVGQRTPDRRIKQ